MDGFQNSGFIMMQSAQISSLPGLISIIFYSPTIASQSMMALESRKYMYLEKLIISDCFLRSNSILHDFEVVAG